MWPVGQHSLMVLCSGSVWMLFCLQVIFCTELGYVVITHAVLLVITVMFLTHLDCQSCQTIG